MPCQSHKVELTYERAMTVSKRGRRDSNGRKPYHCRYCGFWHMSAPNPPARRLAIKRRLRLKEPDVEDFPIDE